MRRAADLFGPREALVYGQTRRSYTDYFVRATRLASALANAGVQPGNVVATLLPNIPAHAEAHFGVPACGAVLNAINTRLDVDTVSYILGHGGAKLLLADGALLDLARAACATLDTPPRIILVADHEAGFAPTGEFTDYEAFLASGDPHFAWVLPQDEWESLAREPGRDPASRQRGDERLLQDPEATRAAFRGGWFQSGDIAFQHPDGYIKIADRAKDIIISGGENVSSVEVEGVLMKHPAVGLAAVVAKPDAKFPAPVSRSSPAMNPPRQS